MYIYIWHYIGPLYNNASTVPIVIVHSGISSKNNIFRALVGVDIFCVGILHGGDLSAWNFFVSIYVGLNITVRIFLVEIPQVGILLGTVFLVQRIKGISNSTFKIQ